jgi:hypothetical protein
MRIRPPAPVKTMVSSEPQVPIGDGPSHSVTGPPPLSDTFFSFPGTPNPTHRPSGEKNGLNAPSVPGIGVGSR